MLLAMMLLVIGSKKKYAIIKTPKIIIQSIIQQFAYHRMRGI